ncbi:hypothetical protein HDV57DRAFT_34419 [Trichoderma longibrachiatum]|uniref:Secreted protein n=1 Tax=Trichoderma longibrachiatum ATCC 18648 TaxID=983965 RepID=A0A2T4CHV8_TRILO|nr:hypothetical protein M440DRAFT_1007747 [Trichoderma longibrachiatum ATCC 18648]
MSKIVEPFSFLLFFFSSFPGAGNGPTANDCGCFCFRVPFSSNDSQNKNGRFDDCIKGRQRPRVRKEIARFVEMKSSLLPRGHNRLLQDREPEWSSRIKCHPGHVEPRLAAKEHGVVQISAVRIAVRLLEVVGWVLRYHGLRRG